MSMLKAVSSQLHFVSLVEELQKDTALTNEGC